MSFLKVNSWKGVLIHLVIILALSGILFYSIFYIWLPSYTKFGETKNVPLLEKLSVSEAEDILKANDLRLVIQDTTYNSRFEPGAITRQEPSANTKVKENRRVYVSINTAHIPKIKIKSMKNLVNTNYENVSSKLLSLGFKPKKKMVSGKYKNYVVGLLYEGDTVRVGTEIRQGGIIDVITWRGQ